MIRRNLADFLLFSGLTACASGAEHGQHPAPDAKLDARVADELDSSTPPRGGAGGATSSDGGAIDPSGAIGDAGDAADSNPDTTAALEPPIRSGVVLDDDSTIGCVAQATASNSMASKR